METVSAIGPSGHSRTHDGPYFERGFFGSITAEILEKLSPGEKLSEEQIGRLEEARDFFLKAKEGFDFLVTGKPLAESP